MAECRAQGLFSVFMSDHFCDLGYSGCTSIPTLDETQVKKKPKKLKNPKSHNYNKEKLDPGGSKSLGTAIHPLAAGLGLKNPWCLSCAHFGVLDQHTFSTQKAQAKGTATRTSEGTNPENSGHFEPAVASRAQELSSLI